MPHRYPYLAQDRLLALRLDNDFESSAGATPPSGAAGGAGQFKFWMDTSVSPPALRMATAARATAGAYVATEWATLATLDLSTRLFSFGNIGSINVSNITAASGTFSGGVSVGGTLLANTVHAGSGIFDTTLTVPTINATTGNFSGGVNVTGALTAGSVHASSGIFDTTLTVPTINATTGNFSGGINVTGTVLAGNVHASSGSIDGAFSIVGTLNAGGLNVGGVSNLNQLNANSVNANSGVSFEDRAVPSTSWEWYANNGYARLNNNFGSDVLLISNYGDVHIFHNLSIDGNLGVFGSVGAAVLLGGPNGAGTLQNWGSPNIINFRWDGVTLNYRIDEAADKKIVTAQGGILNQIGINAGIGGSPTGYALVGFSSDATAFVSWCDAASDVRLKENINDSPVDALASVLATPVRAFDWNPAGRRYMPDIAPHVSLGLVAQELLETMPDAVGVSDFSQFEAMGYLPADMHSVVYDRVVAYLVRAIQQMHDEITDLKKRLN